VVRADPQKGTTICVADLAKVSRGTEFRRSVLEKDGNEVVGAVVMMRHGENPLEVTRRIKDKIQELQAGLPEGVRIVPFYDHAADSRGHRDDCETLTRDHYRLGGNR
jgi:Cu/Ag efflux pump CusA